MTSAEKIFNPGPNWRPMVNDDIPAQTYLKVVHEATQFFWVPVTSLGDDQ